MTKLDVALGHLARGFSIIPLWPKSKVAMVPWVQFQARIATEAEVRAWWANEPEANVGIVTGGVSGVIVGDVDPRHGGSVEQMQKDAPSNFVVTTPGGGAHFYYRHPGGHVKKGKPRPGIDRQSDGCYVVAAGSYVVTDAYQGEYHQVAEGATFPDAPAWLLGEPEAETVPPPAADTWIADALVKGCPPGTRNDTIARLAGYLAGKGIPLDVAHPLIWRWAREQDGTHVTQQECARTVRSIYDKERRSHATVSTGFVVDEFAEDAPTKLERVSLSEFGARYFNEVTEWLIPEWLPTKSIAFIVSPPGRFKTMLTFDLAISVAGGWPFLGTIPVQHPGPVLVIQQEDDYGDMARRFSRIFAARQPGRDVPPAGDDEIAKHLEVSNIPPVEIVTTRGFTLDIDHLRELERLIREVRPRVVVIDPLYSITGADDFMMRAARDMMPLKRLRDAYDVGFLIAAHTKKGASLGREGLWGSQFLNAFLETGWQIRDREDGEPNQIQVQRHFKSSGVPPIVNLEFLLDDDDGYRVLLSDPEEDSQPQDAVLRSMGPDPRTAEAIAETAGLGLRTTQRRLAKLQREGHVVKQGDRWHVPIDRTKEVA